MFSPLPPRPAHAAARPPRARYLSVPQLVIVVGVALLALLALSGPLRAANTGGTEQADPYNPGMNAYVGQYDMAGYVGIDGGYTGNVYGGQSTGDFVQANTVILTTGTVTGTVYGGSSWSDEAKQNIVTLYGAQVGEYIFGGHVLAGTSEASYNIVNINGGTVESVYGGASASGSALRNDVTINGLGSAWSPSGAVVNHDVFGGFVNNAADSSITAAYNSVDMNGGMVAGNIYGGMVESGAGAATDNTVTMIYGTVAQDITGGESTSGASRRNAVTISGGSVNGYVYGGYSHSGDATDNTVTISGLASVDHDVYAGFAESGGVATGNTVRIEGTPTFGPTSVLYGGNANTGSGDVRTGNTLEMWTTGVSVKGLRNFQSLHFYLPSTIAAGSTVLTVADAVDISTPTTGPSTGATTVGVGIMGGGAPTLATGDSVTLIKSNTSLTADAGLANTISGMQGISTLYTFTLETSADALVARVGGASNTHEGIRKSPSEGQAAGVAALTQGGDMAGGQGMASAQQAARAASAGGTAQGGWGGFGSTSGGMSTYATGSHVDARGVSLMLGLAKRFGLDGADLVAGPLFEAGVGSYDSYNDGPGGDDSIHAWGDSSYQGGGLLARLEATQGMLKGLYGEASARAGSLHTTYRSDDLNPALGRASYQTTSGYVGAHGGLGYVWELDETTDLDMYGKYFWTRTEGSSVTVLGDDLDFDAVDSQRLRAGARLSCDLTANIRPYVGAAWDHEFAGSARSTVNGQSVAAPSLAGDTGVGEVGLVWKPVEDSGFSVDLGAQGYVGMRQGWSGALQVKYEF